MLALVNRAQKQIEDAAEAEMKILRAVGGRLPDSNLPPILDRPVLVFRFALRLQLQHLLAALLRVQQSLRLFRRHFLPRFADRLLVPLSLPA